MALSPYGTSGGIINSKGELFTFGNGERGQLGNGEYGPDASTVSPCKVATMWPKRSSPRTVPPT